MLVMVIGGPVEAEEPQDMQMEEASSCGREHVADDPIEVAAISAAECAGMARLLLNLILEMFGAVMGSACCLSTGKTHQYTWQALREGI